MTKKEDVETPKGKKADTKAKADDGQKMSGIQKFCIGIYFVIWVALTLYFLIATWPGGNAGSVEYFQGRLTFGLGTETRLILLIILMGALGAGVHLGTSFVYFAGRKELNREFIAWYLLRPFIGAALAVIFYLTFRGLFFTTGATPDDINLHGVLAIAGLVGMFSKQATEKLRTVFDELFTKVENIEKEGETVENVDTEQFLTELKDVLSRTVNIEMKGTVDAGKLKKELNTLIDGLGGGEE